MAPSPTGSAAPPTHVRPAGQTGPMSDALPFALAQRHVERALALAETDRVRLAVVVVDRGGAVVSAARMDGVAAVNLEMARRKAHAAMLLEAPTGRVATSPGTFFSPSTLADPILRAQFDGMADQLLVVPGGFPVLVGYATVGGFAVAGAHYEGDHEIGARVVAELSASPEAPPHAG